MIRSLPNAQGTLCEERSTKLGVSAVSTCLLGAILALVFFACGRLATLLPRVFKLFQLSIFYILGCVRLCRRNASCNLEGTLPVIHRPCGFGVTFHEPRKEVSNCTSICHEIRLCAWSSWSEMRLGSSGAERMFLVGSSARPRYLKGGSPSRKLNPLDSLLWVGKKDPAYWQSLFQERTFQDGQTKEP